MRIAGYDELNQEDRLPIHIPDMGELITFPFFENAEKHICDMFWTPTQRDIFSQFPLRGKHKYTLYTFFLRFLNVTVSAYPDKFLPYQKQWHLPITASKDVLVGEDEDVYYHLTNASTSTLEVCKDSFDLDYKTDQDPFPIRGFNFDLLKQKPALPSVALIPNTVNIYASNSLIRSVDSSRIEFRLDMRVIETNDITRFSTNNYEIRIYDYKRIGYRDGIIKKQNQAITIQLPDIYLSDTMKVKQGV